MRYTLRCTRTNVFSFGYSEGRLKDFAVMTKQFLGLYFRTDEFFFISQITSHMIFPIIHRVFLDSNIRHLIVQTVITDLGKPSLAFFSEIKYVFWTKFINNKNRRNNQLAENSLSGLLSTGFTTFSNDWRISLVNHSQQHLVGAWCVKIKVDED